MEQARPVLVGHSPLCTRLKRLGLKCEQKCEKLLENGHFHNRFFIKGVSIDHLEIEKSYF